MRRKSTGRYPPNWKEISMACKQAAGFKCVRCGHAHDPQTGYTLTVHHLDMDPSNCEWWNLAALCQRCHLSIQARVIMERHWLYAHSDWFKPYVAGYYAHIMGYPTDKEFVMRHLDFLLCMGKGKYLL